MQLNFDVILLHGLNTCLISKSGPLTVLVSVKLWVAVREWCSFVSQKKKKVLEPDRFECYQNPEEEETHLKH